MNLSLSIFVDSDVSSQLSRRLQNLAYIDENEITIPFLEKVDWSSVVHEVKQAGYKIDFSSINFEEDEDWKWHKPSPHWIAAVISPFGVSTCENPEAELDAPVGIDHRPVSPDVSLKVGYISEDEFWDCQGNWVISQKLARLIDMPLKSRFNVVHEGRTLPDFVRCSVESKCEVIAPFVSYNDQNLCYRCNLPERTFRGVWIARDDDFYVGSLAADKAGFGHLESEHPLVIPLETAAKVVKQMGRSGYHLEPLFAASSPRAALVQGVIEACAAST